MPPHSSHLLQPLDLAIFKSIKTKWDESLCAWTRRHQGQKLPKHELSNILCSIWTKLDEQIIKNGFSKAGIYPFNNSVIDKNRFDPESLKRWMNSQENNNSINLGIVRIEPQDNDLPGPTDNQELNSISSTPSYTSFEELLLSFMKQVGSQKSSKRKVTSGASVITSEEAIQMLREKDNEKKTPKKKKKRVATIQEDTEKNENEIIDKVINNNINFDDDLLLNLSVCSNESDLLNEIERADIELALQENLERSEHQIGDWLLIKYYVGKSQKTVYYVGTVHEIKNQIYKMRFLKFKNENKNSTSFIYSNNDDIDEIDENNIICRLPESSIGRRGEMVFAISFAQYNLAK